jgi:hypothetical protein
VREGSGGRLDDLSILNLSCDRVERGACFFSVEVMVCQFLGTTSDANQLIPATRRSLLQGRALTCGKYDATVIHHSGWSVCVQQVRLSAFQIQGLRKHFPCACKTWPARPHLYHEAFMGSSSSPSFLLFPTEYIPPFFSCHFPSLGSADGSVALDYGRSQI